MTKGKTMPLFEVRLGPDGTTVFVDPRTGKAKDYPPDPEAAPTADEIDADSLTQREKVLMVAQDAQFWRDGDYNAYADVEVTDNDGRSHIERHAVNGSGFQRWLLRRYGEMFPTVLPNGTEIPSAPSSNALKADPYPHFTWKVEKHVPRQRPRG
jgi:hypothetical protein